MAIWQFTLYFIPKQSLLNKYPSIPEKLHIDHDAWDKYYKENELTDEYDFEDALTINWWSNSNILTTDVFPILNYYEPISQDSFGSVKYFGNADTNNITVCYNKETNKIEDLDCRIDLRKIDTKFINNVFDFAKQFECLLMDRQGRLIEPVFSKLMDAIKLSNSFRFVTNPTDFLDDLSKGIIKPE